MLNVMPLYNPYYIKLTIVICSHHTKIHFCWNFPWNSPPYSCISHKGVQPLTVCSGKCPQQYLLSSVSAGGLYWE